jgi:hypothetical protein
MAETNCESGDGGDKRSEAKRTHEDMVARSPDNAADSFGVVYELPASRGQAVSGAGSSARPSRR